MTKMFVADEFMMECFGVIFRKARGSFDVTTQVAKFSYDRTRIERIERIKADFLSDFVPF